MKSQDEHSLSRAMMAHSPTGKPWWLLPSAAALFYPLTVKALYESGKLLHRVNGPGDMVGWIAIAVSVGLVYGVPAVGVGAAYLLGRDERTSSAELMARRLAHLAVASPPLFVLIGVMFYLLHAPSGDSVLWWILWLAAGPRCSLACRAREESLPSRWCGKWPSTAGGP